ncbi:MAG TPA: response regulator [Isosphaeraceae bacterium]|jgi:DNA-binding response OmpR family regulator
MTHDAGRPAGIEAGLRPSTSSEAGDRAEGLAILVVEDNPDILRYLVLLLEQAGHRVRPAANFAEAVDAAVSGPIDVLLSDIGLPDGSGLELLRTLRNDRPGLPAVAFSGFGSDDDVRHSLEAGFAAHLTKPLDFRRLSLAIRNAVAE